MRGTDTPGLHVPGIGWGEFRQFPVWGGGTDVPGQSFLVRLLSLGLWVKCRSTWVVGFGEFPWSWIGNGAYTHLGSWFREFKCWGGSQAQTFLSSRSGRVPTRIDFY